MEVKMKNRTCSGCRYITEDGGYCVVWGNIAAALEPCELFELPKKLTNGDRIRSMSDESLAEVLMDLYDGNKCKYCAYMKSGMCSLKPRHEEYDEGGWVEDEDCIRGMIEYLKKEVENE